MSTFDNKSKCHYALCLSKEFSNFVQWKEFTGANEVLLNSIDCATDPERKRQEGGEGEGKVKREKVKEKEKEKEKNKLFTFL